MTWLRARTLKEPGLHRDRGHGAVRGLFLQVTASTAKEAVPGEVARSWIYRYVSPLTKKTRSMGMGPVDIVGLDDARQRATAARRLVKVDRRDPLIEREIERRTAAVEAEKMRTFAQVAAEYIAKHRCEWKSPKHLSQWQHTFRVATKAINDLPVAMIDTDLVLSVLNPIWHVKTQTASRVRGRIEAVLAFATFAKYRSGENPARLRGHLEHALAAKAKIAPVTHLASVGYVALPAVMVQLRAKEGIAARALELKILTASRTKEVRLATWNEIDMDSKIWTRPPDHMKMGVEHRVPLCDDALRLLASLPRDAESQFIFPGTKPRRPMADDAMRRMLNSIAGKGFTPHGTARSSFRDWARDVSPYPDAIAEVALAHKEDDETVAAYLRSDALIKRRAMMIDWSRYCAGFPGAGNVMPIAA